MKAMEAIQGDITKLAVDAIVNAANKSLLGGGGVDGAIHRAAGPLLLEECRKLNGCQTGEAKITKGYNLSAKYVVHTVGPVYRGRPEDKILLANCYRNSLSIAVENNLSSIAFPAISCGIYGYPLDKACEIAVTTTANFLKQSKGKLKVFFVFFSASDLEIYKEFFQSI
ncbi:MAG: O-acetyl-ADP-ribose deacetylase [Desulfobacteraceae bacterium]|nr:O-acetyl-ADP-ribose deacetylase [Desulfobacteraceae bacterium]MBC2756943.1 O-acetyl-ADP-ribose deacetylase [Desulfobacteraceae bacterium]